MNILITTLATIGYIVGASLLTVGFWLGLMWLVSIPERRKPIKTHCTPEEIEQFVEMTKKERRRKAKERLKLHRRSKKFAYHDEEAQRWLDENEKESA